MIELAEAILDRLEENACLGGETVQHLAYYLIQSLEKVEGYLTHEPIKNYREAFLASYQIFPYGKFAHLLANSMIMNSVPKNADCSYRGLWHGRRRWKGMLPRCSEVNLYKVGGKGLEFSPSLGRFGKIKSGLLECVDHFNLRLEVEEMEMEVLAKTFNKMEVKGEGKEWLALDCMVNLPHMGRVRSERHRLDFLKLAKDSLRGSENKGIITLGDGNMEGKMGDYSGFG